jgi:hypothetical protein
MKCEQIVMCRHCNTPRSPTSDCSNPNCPGKFNAVKWGPPNSRKKGPK